MNKQSIRVWARVVGAALCAATLSFGSLALAAPGEVSFTPTGLKISVMRITLSLTGDNGAPQSQQVLYTCPFATEAECLVDVTDQTALDTIATQVGSATVAVGTYDTVSLEMCAAGKIGGTPAPGFVRGLFEVPSEGRSYATDAEESNITGLKEVHVPADTTGADAGADAGLDRDASNSDGGFNADAGPGANADAGASADAPEWTAIGNWGCSTKTVLLRSPINVTENAATELTVVMDSKFIASSTPNTSPGMGGCRGMQDGHARGVCVAYPSIVPLVGAETPELDRFLLAHHRTDPNAIDDPKANAYVVVVRGTQGGTPLTAFVRPYFSETSATPSSNTVPDPVFGGPGYFGETMVSSVQVGDDGSMSFTTGGSLDGNAAIFGHFQVADHFGVVDTREAGSWQYHAFPLPPQ